MIIIIVIIIITNNVKEQKEMGNIENIFSEIDHCFCMKV